MIITFDLPACTDHPTAGPPVTPAHFGYDPVGNVEVIEDIEAGHKRRTSTTMTWTG